jgi:cellulose synthase/poly-beta-1,6-N-acetylglucosamine synthase-like glycosyltransferase
LSLFRRAFATPASREIAFTIVMLALTALATVFLAIDLAGDLSRTDDPAARARGGVFTAVVAILIYANAVYLATRLGYYIRRRDHRPARFQDLVDGHWSAAEPVTVLVPSYKEDPRTIRQTLLSAALQHYPRKRVVLLVDDPQQPADAESEMLLAAARAMPAEIDAVLGDARGIVRRAEAAFRSRVRHGRVDASAERRALLETYGDLVAWMERCVAATPVRDHTDRHFVRVTYRDHQALLRQRARDLVMRLRGRRRDIDVIGREYRRLAEVFAVDLAVFERKRYVNVSHDASKAANLNTYIGLLGTKVREVWRGDGWHLEPADGDAGRVTHIPDATYVLTLDADSMLRPEYTLRLAAEMAAPGNERVAVVQTPYTAIPGAPGVLERIAGATTDIQYIVHQGFTFFGATFWVGANALLRKSALDDIRIDAEERGHPIRKYIQDRTVIEDTESTIDLADEGWTLRNYPARLAYSATPPDFGSLLIQRRRWANGGLLIAPKLVRQLFARGSTAVSVPSFLVRIHYLTSIATGALGLIVLLAMPLDATFVSVWLPVLAVPYFGTYWRDLVELGYRRGDILRVWSLNMMLLPVNLAGVLKSMQQAATGTPTPFGRTPKVEGRTAAPAWSVLAVWAMALWTLAAGIEDLLSQRWLPAGFSLMVAAGFLYAAVVFIGPRAGWEDVTLRLREVRARAGEWRRARAA